MEPSFARERAGPGETERAHTTRAGEVAPLLQPAVTFTTYVGLGRFVMRRRVSWSILMACALGWATPASAARSPGRAASDGRLERPSGAVSRDARDAKFQVAPPSRRAALARFEAEVGPLRATWDPATEVPHRLLLSGVPAPDAMRDPVMAERVARDLLARHLDLLAPGALASDFILAANESSAGIRSVGFVQTHDGMTVLGGQVSFRFKNDRLVMIGSGAYPDVSIPSRSRSATVREVGTHAQAWVTTDVPGALVGTGAVEGPFVLPLVDGTGTVVYREVFRTSLELSEPATAWTVYVDAESGSPVARRQTLLYGTGQLLLDVPARNPAGPRLLQPADRMSVTVDGLDVTTNPAGTFDFPGAAATIEPVLSGVFASVSNDDGPQATTALNIADGGATQWQESAEEAEAQLSAYAHTMIVKNFVRTISDAPWLDDTIPVVVNIGDTCNAFSDGNSINFFRSGGGCENTALLADVVYHEFGHSIHAQSLIPGVGEFNVSLSEGISDYLSATLTEDSGLGRGFFFDDQPLRDFDPEGFEYRWPEDRGEVHDEGLIIGGALWDLRKRMRDALGPLAGTQYVDQLWYETTRRAVDIPSMYPEALLFDDDDGNLLNGTPNACEINAAYGPHGLFNPGPASERVTIEPGVEAATVSLSLTLPNFPDCPIAAAPTLRYRLRGSDDETEVPMTPALDDLYTAELPPQPSGTVYEVQVLPGYDIDPGRTLPDNVVDPWYTHYVGEVIELGCLGRDSDFDAGPGWQVGEWAPDSSATDPTEPGGEGDHLWQLASYPPGSANEIAFGPVDTQGYANVRLQLRRWLAVEDGFFDRAFIRVNDEPLWRNFAASEDFLASFHHIDKEWRFVDFDISDLVGPQGVQITFGTQADGGLEFGGWSLAEVCVVAVDGPMAACGNGVLEAFETCDDGNQTPGDGCDATCQSEPVDPSDPTGTTGSIPPGDDDSSGGDPDDAPLPGDTDGDTDGPGLDGDALVERGCVCSGGGSSGGPQGALLLLLLGVLRRRRCW